VTAGTSHILRPAPSRGSGFVPCEGFRTPADDSIRTRRQQALEKRQWRKSREVGDYGAAGSTRVWAGRNRRWRWNVEWWHCRPGTSRRRTQPELAGTDLE